MKKLVKVILLIICVTMIFTACASTTTEETATTETQTEIASAETETEEESVTEETTTGRKIAYQVIGMDATVFKLQLMGAQSALREGDELVALSMDYDNEKQLTQIENMIAQEVDAIVIMPKDSTANAVSVQKAYDAGIPVMTVYMTVDNPECLFAEYSGDDHAIGYYGAVTLAEAHYEKYGNYEGKILMYCSTAEAVGQRRYDGFMDGLAEYPDMEVVYNILDEWTTDAAFAPIESVLVSHPEIDCFWAPNEAPAIAAVQIFEEQSRDDIVIVINDATSWGCEQIRAGTIYGCYDTDPFNAGVGAMELVYDYLDGKTVEKESYITHMMITLENVDECITANLEETLDEDFNIEVQ
ncbi:MAG: sugar ABC transporter substrate-binding protein [Eubacteriales bacterium]|nr:sugar ABC transporter substrate-binding protein [Eubacteriales bacterium]